MKKLISLALTTAMILSAVSCSAKNTENSSDTSVTAPSVEVSQLMYKQTDVDFPEDFSGRVGLYYYNGVRFIYRDKENNIKIMCYDEEMNEASTIELMKVSDDYHENYCCTHLDGSITLMLMKVVSDDEIGSEEYYENADVSFELYTFSPDGEQLEAYELTGFDDYFTYGSSFVSSVSVYGENYIITFNDGLALVNGSGEVIDVTESNDYLTFGTDTEGNTIAGAWDNYNYLDGNTLNYDQSSALEYGKWDKLMGDILTGTGDFKAYFVLNYGIFGLTYGDELIKLVDYLSSNITANGVRFSCYGGEGKFIIMGDDQTSGSGLFYLLLTVRPDDYVENKQTVVLGCNRNDNNAQEIATMYNKKSDSYTVEVKKYSSDDDLKFDVLSGEAPDLYCYGESATMYRYANLGAFADIYELMEQNDGIKQDDIIENVLQAMEYKGGLYGLPIAFGINPYIANREVIGREYTNWNYEEFFSFAENMPEGMYLGTKNSPFAYRDIMFDYLCTIGSWVDYDNYTCNFDSEEFIHLLEFCMNTEINEPYDWGGVISTQNEAQMIEYKEAEMSVKNKTSLLYATNLGYPPDFISKPIITGLYHDDNYTYLIAPSNDRRGTILISNNMCFSVLNNASCPDGAWDFFNYIMNPKFQNDYLQTMYSFTTNKASFEYKMNKAMEESQYYKFRTNDPTLYSIDPDDSWLNDSEYFSHPLTEENMEYFTEFIMNCNKLVDYDSAVYTIIKEEYAAFINGETTAQKCAEMIQNRVSLYLSEQS